jgi:hypothetical protein
MVEKLTIVIHFVGLMIVGRYKPVDADPHAHKRADIGILADHGTHGQGRGGRHARGHGGVAAAEDDSRPHGHRAFLTIPARNVFRFVSADNTLLSTEVFADPGGEPMLRIPLEDYSLRFQKPDVPSLEVNEGPDFDSTREAPFLRKWGLNWGGLFWVPDLSRILGDDVQGKIFYLCDDFFSGHSFPERDGQPLLQARVELREGSLRGDDPFSDQVEDAMWDVEGRPGLRRAYTDILKWSITRPVDADYDAVPLGFYSPDGKQLKRTLWIQGPEPQLAISNVSDWKGWTPDGSLEAPHFDMYYDLIDRDWDSPTAPRRPRLIYVGEVGAKLKTTRGGRADPPSGLAIADTPAAFCPLSQGRGR